MLSEKNPWLRGSLIEKENRPGEDEDNSRYYGELEYLLPKAEHMLAWTPSAANAQVRWEDQFVMQPPCKRLELFFGMKTKDEVSQARFFCEFE